MADFHSRMASLRERFIIQTASEADQIARCEDAQHWGNMRDICHGLAGRAGMFGFAALGDAARAVEEAIDRGMPPTRLSPLIARLSVELTRLPRV